MDKEGNLQFPQSDPVLDRLAKMDEDAGKPLADVPSDQTLYRTRGGMLLTMSMITRGWGRGQQMTGVSHIDENTEGRDLLKQFQFLESKGVTLSAFELQIRKDIQEALDTKWMV